MLDGYTMDVLEQRIGYCFHNKALLKQALTHHQGPACQCQRGW